MPPAAAKRPENASYSSTLLEGEMQILLISFAAIAGIWLVVLWGSRYLGPQ